jgi:hypothetical protein
MGIFIATRCTGAINFWTRAISNISNSENRIIVSKKNNEPLTLSGVDEKPQNEAPIVTLYRGFLFYSVLTEAGAAIGCKVGDLICTCLCTISGLALRPNPETIFR